MKKFCIQFFVTVFVLLAGIVIFNWAVDPFFHYREPKEPLVAYMHMPVYQTAGAAEHFTYDCAIVGTSMTENFRVSWFEEMGLDAVKLSYSGARSSDIKAILEKVFDSNNEVKLIVIDVNDYQLTTDPMVPYTERPVHLYNDNWVDDSEYLINNDVFWISAGRVLEAATDNQPILDDAYTWEDPALFSEERVKESCREYVNSLKEQIEAGTIKPYDGTRETEWCMGNLQNILPVIEAHPETEFVFFYPPYCIIYWEQLILSRRLDTILDIYRTSAETLLAYDNVRVFYFQNEEEIITNLDLYRDVGHHNHEINRYIFECIKTGEKELTIDNLEETFVNMYRIASEYPYEEIWEE